MRGKIQGAIKVHYGHGSYLGDGGGELSLLGGSDM